jgi:hypothetical protein
MFMYKSFFFYFYASILVMVLFCDYSKSNITMVFGSLHIFEKHTTSVQICFMQLEYEHASHAKSFFPFLNAISNERMTFRMEM